MRMFDVLLLIGGICGLLMVCGAFLLLYRGIITLSETPKEDAVSIEFRKQFKVATQYPALGLFIIGLAFIAMGLSFASPEEPVSVTGKTVMVDGLNVIASREWSFPVLAGEIDGSVPPGLDELSITVSAPGHLESKLRIAVHGRSVDLGELQLTKVTDHPVTKTVAELPEGFTQPPLSAPTFGKIGS